ncbi:MAG TPA: cupredoxin domain-containing protein [Acidimicrobiales bacterium]|nr:cupredoxin domain-containing protein [Acidimicrobiales bacterium]
MLNPAAKFLLAVTLGAMGVAVAYQLAVDERAGLVLFVVLAGAAFAAVIATAGANVPDQAPFVPKDAPPPERRATTTGAPARGSGWPLVAALAVGVLACTAAVGGPVVWIGVVLLVVAVAGWFGKAWSEDPSWTPHLSERARLRLLIPLALPVGLFLMVATIAICVSRILLAVSKDSSVVLAMAVAITILVTCSILATRPRVTSAAVIGVAVLAVASLVGVGITGAVAGERQFHPEESEGTKVDLEAKNIKYSTDQIRVRAGEKVEIHFHNADVGTYHNMAIYEGDGADAAPVFNGAGFPGDNLRLYSFEAPPPGAYVFVCDFHANMKGQLIVEQK